MVRVAVEIKISDLFPLYNNDETWDELLWLADWSTDHSSFSILFCLPTVPRRWLLQPGTNFLIKRRWNMSWLTDDFLIDRFIWFSIVLTSRTLVDIANLGFVVLLYMWKRRNVRLTSFFFWTMLWNRLFLWIDCIKYVF